MSRLARFCSLPAHRRDAAKRGGVGVKGQGNRRRVLCGRGVVPEAQMAKPSPLVPLGEGPPNGQRLGTICGGEADRRSFGAFEGEAQRLTGRDDVCERVTVAPSSMSERNAVGFLSPHRVGRASARSEGEAMACAE